MPESYEAMMIRLGFDAGEVKVGTDAMLGVQKRAAVEYAALWQTAAEKKLAAEQTAVAASFRLFEADLKKRVEARAAADALIAAGSVPENMAAGAARKAEKKTESEILGGFEEGASIITGAAGVKYIAGRSGKILAKIGKGGEIEKGADEAAKGLKAIGEAAHTGASTMIRESMVLVREGLRGAYTRVLGSLSILIGASSSVLGPVARFIQRIPVVSHLLGPVGAVLDAVTIGTTIGEGYRAYEARKAAAQSGKALEGSEKNEGELLRKRVEDLQNAGVITEAQATAYREQLKNGQTAQVAIATDPLLKNGTAADILKKFEDAKETARVQAETKKEQEKAAYDAASPQDKYNMALLKTMEIKRSMLTIQKFSKEYYQAEFDLNQSYIQSSEALKNLKKSIADADKEAAEKQKEHDRETFELNKQYQHELMDGQRKQADIDNIGFESPTIGQLAGRVWSAREERAYGKGGVRDLESGRGPFAEAARDAIRAKNQMMWDLERGDAEFSDVPGENGRVIGQKLTGGAAFEDQQWRIRSENLLRAAGLDTPEMKANRMAESLDAMQSSLAEIQRAATRDGIALKDSQ